MKREFQKFQHDFYAEVENRLPEFNEKVHTFMITDIIPGTDIKSKDSLEVIFGFVDATGKDRTESVLINKTEDVKAAVAEFNDILKEEYPAFAHYKNLEDVITTAVTVNDPDNIYTYTVQGTNRSTDRFKVYDLTVRIRESDGELIVWYEDRDDTDDEYEPYFNYDLSKWKPSSIEVDIENELFDDYNER